MSSNKSSMLLPAIVVLILGGLGFGYFFITEIGFANADGTRSTVDLRTGKVSSVSVDADLPTETLDTIASTTIEIKDQYQGVVETNAIREKQISDLQKQLAESLKQNQDLLRKFNAQSRKLDGVISTVSENQAKPNTIDASSLKLSVSTALRDILPSMLPKSDSIPEAIPAFEINENTVPKEPAFKPVTRTRIRSFGVQVDRDGNIDSTALSQNNGNSGFQRTNSNSTASELGTTRPVSSHNSSASENAIRQGEEEVIVDPRFTIPSDSVLNDSVTITALVGRIPREGDVNDPSPFKVAIGRDNLAANGFTIPGIDGMIMSGFVYGDAVRRCVRTKITRATYIFEDGRILTLPSKQKAANVLGYLADSQTGDPCIAGAFYTNGNSALRKNILAGMAAGAANAFAQTQVTSTTNASGGTSNTVTGDSSKYVLGSAVSNGANTVASYLDKQKFDQWDQVVVPVGRTVSIHMDESLELDNTTALRKIVYENDTDNYGLTD